MDCNDVLTIMCRITCNNQTCTCAGKTWNMIVCSVNQYDEELANFGDCEDHYCTRCGVLGVLEQPSEVCSEYIEDDVAPFFVLYRFTPRHIETLIRLVRNHADGDAPSEEIVRLAIDDDIEMQNAFYFAQSTYRLLNDGTYDIVTQSDQPEINKIIGVCHNGVYFQADVAPDGESQNFVTRRSRDRKSTRLNSSHVSESRMPSSA